MTTGCKDCGSLGVQEMHIYMWLCECLWLWVSSIKYSVIIVILFYINILLNITGINVF